MSPRVPVLGLALLFAIVSGPAFAADRELTVDDVLRLHFAGVSEDVIISEIIVTESVFDLGVSELLRLKEAGLSDRLIQFMVDSALPREDRLPLEEYDATAPEGDTWVNVIDVDPEPRYEYRVSLHYRYPAWWYDNYWYDYWYYDCSYAPYRSNWSFSIGVWYPGWWGWGGLYVWPGCGYRDYCWGYRYPYACEYVYPTYYYRGHPSAGNGLSPVKYKSGGATPVIASAAPSRGVELKMRDGRSTTPVSASWERPDRGKRSPTDLAVVGDATGRRPVRKVSTGTRAPASVEARIDARTPRPTRPTRVVRAPAPSATPRKVITTRPRTPGAVETPKVRKPTSGVTAPAPTPSRTPSTVREPSAPSAPRSSPAPRSAPRSPSGGGSKSTRSGGGKGR